MKKEIKNVMEIFTDAYFHNCKDNYEYMRTDILHAVSDSYKEALEDVENLINSVEITRSGGVFNGDFPVKFQEDEERWNRYKSQIIPLIRNLLS